MAVIANLNFDAIVTELTALNNVAGQSSIDQSIRYQLNLGAGSTPVVDDVWFGRTALSAGTVTLLLDALVRTPRTALNLTGKHVYAFVIRNLSGNASMTFAPAGTNPYPIGGSGSGLVAVGGGDIAILTRRAGYGLVSGTVSDITVTGTGTQSFDMLILAGTP